MAVEVRGFVVVVAGRSGDPVRVVFDRYGTNRGVFDGRDDRAATNHAVSAAMRAAVTRHGADWITGYTFHPIG